MFFRGNNYYLYGYYITKSQFLFAMKTGTVKFFNESKGFGFIVDDENQREVFVHISGLVDKINQGDKVTFNVTEGRKGPNAIEVKLA